MTNTAELVMLQQYIAGYGVRRKIQGPLIQFLDIILQHWQPLVQENIRNIKRFSAASVHAPLHIHHLQHFSTLDRGPG